MEGCSNFLRKAVLKRPAPPMTPMTTSPKSRPETPGTQASGASNLTEFWPEPPREVQVPTPTKKAKALEESSSGEGLGLCAAGKLCPMPSLALGRGFLALPVSRCTLAWNAKELFIPVCVLLVMATNSFARCVINEE